MATIMLPNDASSVPREIKIIFRTENSNSPKLGINRVLHVIVILYCMYQIQPLIAIITDYTVFSLSHAKYLKLALCLVIRYIIRNAWQMDTRDEPYMIPPTLHWVAMACKTIRARITVYITHPCLWPFFQEAQLWTTVRAQKEPEQDQAGDPACIKSFHSFCTSKILLHVPAFFFPSCILCMFLPSPESFALSKGNRRKEKTAAAFSIDFPPSLWVT